MKRCLLLCPIGIGNYLLAYPTFEQIKRSNPEAKLFLLGLRGAIGTFAQNDPLFEEVLVVDPTKTRSPIGKSKTVAAVRRLQCDTAISFFPSNRLEYNLLAWLSGAKTRYAFRYNLKTFRAGRFLCNHLIDPEDNVHDVEQNLRVLAALGAQQRDPLKFPDLFNMDEASQAEAWLERNGIEGRNLIGLHPGSSPDHGMIHKRWPERRFVGLAKDLSGPDNSVVLVFGGPEENPLKRAIAKRIGESAISVEDLAFRETCALVARCHLFVSNDSGLMHIAALSKVPTVGIFGPTDDIRTAPWGSQHLVIRSQMDCSPCWRISNVGVRVGCKYKDFRCLRKLGVDEVLEKIVEWRGTPNAKVAKDGR